MTAISRLSAPPWAFRAWRHRVAGPVIRLGGGAALTWLIGEIAFGYRTHLQLGPIGFPTGIPAGIYLLGVTTGILYGLVGIGIILVYRANRIISFAQAGLGGVPALLALLLVTNHDFPYALAALIMVVGSVLTGALMEILILRRFLKQPRIIATVATIGIAQLLTLLEIYLPKWLTGGQIPPSNLPTPFTGVHVEIGGVVFNGNHLAVIVAATGMIIALTAFFQRTRLGIAVRASAENPDRALLLGIPVASLSTLVWMIAGLCSGIAVFLRASTIGVPYGGLELSPLVLLYGLAAATIAGMEKLWLAVVAGMLVGIVEQASVFGTNAPDLGAGLMLLLILVALLPRWRQLARAYDTAITGMKTVAEFRPIPVELRGLPEVRGLRILGAVAAAALFLAAPVWAGTDRIGDCTLFVIYAIAAVSVVILSGWAGQISLGQWAFAGVGGAVAGGLAANHGQDFFVAMLAAGVTGAVVALVIGLPALRTQGLYLAVVTLAFAATVENIILNAGWFGWLLPPSSSFNRPVLWGRLPTDTPTGFYYLCVAFLLIAYLSARSLRRSRSARVFVATRDNVRAAQSFGISSARTKLAAFAISGFIAAIAGALFVYNEGSIAPESFNLTTNIDVFLLTVIGGMTSVGGAIAGAVVYIGLRYIGQTWGLASLDTLGIATGALFVLNFFPGGLAQAGFQVRDAILRRIARRRVIVVPSLVADRATRPVQRRTAAATVAPDDAGTLLSCRGVDVGYEQVQVLFGVDAQVQRGETVALLGTNGAGKSTLLRAVSGLNRATSGTIIFDGEDITRLSPMQRVARGIIQVPGGRSIFPTLTVAEHLRIAGWMHVDDDAARQRRESALTMFPRLRERIGQLAGNLSGGEQQQLGLAMAMVAVPRLLIIDELSLGLAPTVVDQLLAAVRGLRDAGVTVLIVEQSVNVALAIAERAYFMEKGEVLFEGETRELLTRDDIVRSVFLEGAGRKRPVAGDSDGDSGFGELAGAVDAVRVAPHLAVAGTDGNGNGAAPLPTDHVLATIDVAASFGGVRAVDGVSLQVDDGEILGIIGPNGAGKTTLFDLLSGYLRPSSGRIRLKGIDVTGMSPDARAWLGLGRSFQDARIFQSMTVAENIATALERHLPLRDHAAAALCLPQVREAEEDVAWTVADLIELMSLGAYRDKFVRELSTGSRRIVDLAMVLAHDPDVLILDEPSSGIAQREAEALGPLLRRIRAETGCALLVIEHDIPLVTSIADRLVTMDLGRVIAEGPPQEVIRDPRVVAAYLGTDQAAIARSHGTPLAAVLGEAVR